MNHTLCENIHWVGFLDWNIRDFHSYNTEHGATYNAYLILDEKNTLIDTVKAPYVETLLENIAQYVEPTAIDYIVCNHAEPDHAGALGKTLAACPNAKLLCNKKCLATLSSYFDTSDWKVQIVENGESISLGKRTLQFMNTPMVHWPESMFTYVPEEKLLFSMDAFGQHLATSDRFDDEVSLCDVMREAKIYYANIVLPYGLQVTKCLEAASKLDIEMIAPSHGVIWRKYIGEILEEYQDWATGRVQPKVLVLYDTMWESTQQMAQAIYDAAVSVPGVAAELIHVRRMDMTHIAAEAIDAAAIAFGSATLNSHMMPTMAGVFTYLKGLKPPVRAAVAFGSCGWGRGGAEQLDAWLDEAKWPRAHDMIKAKYRPDADILAQCTEAGHALAQAALEAAE
ncbi:MAG: FprA family A-type flavoprotein [Planctomycetia bacterium]|jgi:flavorubredoxin